MGVSAPSIETDVLVIGGGPAGLAAAIAARLQNFRVLVADHARPPLDKACGEGLMPDGVRALRELGVHPEAFTSYPLRGIRFISGDISVEAEFPNGVGAGIRRTTLSQALLHRGENTGVEFLWGSRIRDVEASSATIGESRVRYRWLIGADGLNSSVRAQGNFARVRKENVRYGVRRHYRISPWTDFVEVYWGAGHQFYVTPVGDDEVSVALVSRDARARVDALLTQCPILANRLRASVPIEARDRGSLTVSRVLTNVASEDTALVGDASGSVDAITGQGLYLAFRQALHLADTLAENDLKSYSSRHDALMARPLIMSRIMVLLGDHTWLRNLALRAMSLYPAIFARLLAFHMAENRTWIQ